MPTSGLVACSADAALGAEAALGAQCRQGLGAQLCFYREVRPVGLLPRDIHCVWLGSWMIHLCLVTEVAASTVTSQVTGPPMWAFQGEVESSLVCFQTVF